MSNTIACMMWISFTIFFCKAVFWIMLFLAIHFEVKIGDDDMSTIKMISISSYTFIGSILNMLIYIFTVAVMFKLKKIELTMSPKYDTV